MVGITNHFCRCFEAKHEWNVNQTLQGARSKLSDNSLLYPFVLLFLMLLLFRIKSRGHTDKADNTDKETIEALALSEEQEEDKNCGEEGEEEGEEAKKIGATDGQNESEQPITNQLCPQSISQTSMHCVQLYQRKQTLQHPQFCYGWHEEIHVPSQGC